ncbi:MAG: ABC transporter permease, partial [Rhodobacterales bacterium]|nr:ABC transporter permease [Rhodobacterales bacterium]
MDNDLGLWAVPLAMLGGAIRVSTPFLFVSLGEVLTERSGRINLGLEGTLGFGAMAGYATAVLTGSAWADVGLAALNVNVLFLAGAGLAWMLRATRLGLILRVVGDSTDAARALGLRPNLIRALATAAGGALAGVGGAYLSLYYPGSWNEGLSSGQGLMAVALVIFARWNPLACFGAAILFGG